MTCHTSHTLDFHKIKLSTACSCKLNSALEEDQAALAVDAQEVHAPVVHALVETVKEEIALVEIVKEESAQMLEVMMQLLMTWKMKFHLMI